MRADIPGDRILLFDGAMGTWLQELGMEPGHCPDALCLEHSELVSRIHRHYVEAGADIVETNTFGATPLRLSRHGLEHRVRDINIAAVRIAAEAVRGRAMVAGSMGPLGVLVEPLGETSFDEAYEAFAAQADAFGEARPDFIIIETMGDLNELRAAMLACKDRAPGIPVIAQMTLDPNGRTFTGTDPETAGLVMQSLGANAIGFNCSVGPDLLLPAVERLRRVARVPVSAQPNAGMPVPGAGGRAVFPVGPEEFASFGPKLVAAGASLLGGCCGTTPDHIGRLRASVEGLESPGGPGPLGRAFGLSSRTQSVFVTAENRPLVVGRIGAVLDGERKAETDRSELSRVRSEAGRQVAGGAHVLDVRGLIGHERSDSIPSEVGRDDHLTMERAVRLAQKAARVPLCIGSEPPGALEDALKACVGKPLVNGFTPGRGREDEVLRLVRRYGAAVVARPAGEAVRGPGEPPDGRDPLETARALVEAASFHGIPCWDMVLDVTEFAARGSEPAERAARIVRAVRERLGCTVGIRIEGVRPAAAGVTPSGSPVRRVPDANAIAAVLSAGVDVVFADAADESAMDLVRRYSARRNS
ncbi:MAG: homocysteine S-methyltransferase family protein [Firmicutes bacterium]|nr:homocysteine S-methyltransferase family protein [Bacillota bacterium]